MRRTFITSLLVFAWLCANGAVWDFVQVVAWGRMFAGYSESMSVKDALDETFNPEKACELCRSVAAAKEASEKQLPPVAPKDSTKFLMAMQPVDRPVFADMRDEWPATPEMNSISWRDCTPVPPPRV